MSTLVEMANWPAALPLPAVDFNGTPSHAIIGGDTKSSVIQRRLRFTAHLEVIQVALVMTAAQYETFKEFYTDTLYCGAALFVISLRYPVNSALTDWRVRFAGGEINASHDDGYWTVEASLLLIRPVEEES